MRVLSNRSAVTYLCVIWVLGAGLLSNTSAGSLDRLMLLFVPQIMIVLAFHLGKADQRR
jgi:hypothetical protein